MATNGKYCAFGKDFYLKEFELLRNEIELHLQEMRSVERNVALATGVTWAWLTSASTPKAAWLIPILFVLLGSLRCYGHFKQFDAFHRYVARIEAAFSVSDDPGGWERFLRTGNTHIYLSTAIFWLTLWVSTIGVAVYKLQN